MIFVEVEKDTQIGKPRILKDNTMDDESMYIPKYFFCNKMVHKLIRPMKERIRL